MAADDDEVLAAWRRDLANRDLYRSPPVLHLGSEPHRHLAGALAHFLEAQPVRACDSDARYGRHFGVVVFRGRVAPYRFHRTEGNRFVLRMSPVHHDRAGRALEPGDALLLVARRGVGQLGQGDLAADILALVIGEATRADVDELTADALGRGLETVPQGVGGDRHLCRCGYAAVRGIGKTDQAGKGVDDRLDADLTQGVAAVFGHAPAVLRPRQSGRNLAYDMIDMSANVVDIQAGENAIFGHSAILLPLFVPLCRHGDRAAPAEKAYEFTASPGHIKRAVPAPVGNTPGADPSGFRGPGFGDSFGDTDSFGQFRGHLT